MVKDLLATIHAGANTGDLVAVRLASARLKALICKTPDDLGEEAAFQLLDVLTLARLNTEAEDWAELLRRLHRPWTFIDRTFAHVLIERGQFGAAEKILERLLSGTPLAPFDLAFCHAQKGRLSKSRADAARRRGDTTTADTEAAASIQAYRQALTLAEQGEPLFRAWRGAATNLLRYDTANPGLGDLAQRVISRIETRTEKSHFDYSALAQAYRRTDQEAECIRCYGLVRDADDVSPGHIQRILRDFEIEAKQSPLSPSLNELIMSLRAKLLASNHAVEISGDYVRSVLQDFRDGADACGATASSDAAEALARTGTYAVEWLREGIFRSSAVGKVHRRGQPTEAGSGFLMDLAGDGVVFVTCMHVLSRGGNRGSIAADDAEVRFTGLETERVCTVDSILFQSAPVRWALAIVADHYGLDVTIARLRNVPTGLPRLTVAADLEQALRDPTTDPSAIRGGYVTGHPLAGALTITLGPANFSAYKRSTRGNEFVEYATKTRGGHSGSPVFDKCWSVVAVHARGEDLAAATEGDADLETYPGQGALLGSALQAFKEFQRAGA